MDDRKYETGLRFTQEEAFGLLDIVMTSSGELTPEQRNAVLKLSEFCRQCLRERPEAAPGSQSVCAA